jgi:uncharacterized membrane protein YhaH (DUF805 family)
MTVVAGPLCAVLLAAKAAGREDVALGRFIPYVLFVLGAFVLSLAVTFRRLHDIDRPAAWILIVLVPIAGPIVLLIFPLIDGTPGPNRYGPDPRNQPPAPPTDPAAASAQGSD